MNKDIKLIATDLDGTFLNNESEISNFNKEVFEYLSNNGVEIILSTGRPFEGMIRYKRHLNNKNNSIVLNGAIITDSGGKFIYDEPLDEKTALKVMDIYQKYKKENVYLHVYSGNKYIASEENRKPRKGACTMEYRLTVNLPYPFFRSKNIINNKA